LKPSVNELSAIISYDCAGNFEPAYYAPPHEVLDVLGRNGGEGLDLDPFGEVIHPDQEEFRLPFARAEGIDDVHSPYGEQPWRHHVVECLGLEMGQGAILLTLSALHIF